MKPDDLEQRLARTPLRAPPAGWREEILAAARRTKADEAVNDSPARAEAWSVRIAWRRLLDGLRAPWPVLAGAWALVLALNAASTWMVAPTATTPTREPTPAAREIVAAAKAYRAEALGLVLGGEATEATVPGLDRRIPAGVSRPRSDRGPIRHSTPESTALGLA